jgi:hypothetical protein
MATEKPIFETRAVYLQLVSPTIVFEAKENEIHIRIEASYRKEILKFVIEVLTNWLLPGKTLYLSKFNSVRDNGLVICDAVVIPASLEEEEMICENFTLLEEEIKLGVKSVYHAKKLLELKGLFLEEKESYIREALRERVHQFPNDFDSDVFTLMQKFLASVSEEYKSGHSYGALVRIIGTHYLINQRILNGTHEAPDTRHFFLKLIPLPLSTLFGEKLILGCFVGMNFLKDNEVLEDKHLLRAVRKYFPEVTLVEGSYFVQKEEKTLLFYVELQNDDSFSYTEIALLKKELKEQVKGSIESLVRPVFMPRNEEEVMKYIVTLSKQVTSPRDLPQIVILFNEQTADDLIFTLVMVRPLFADTISIHEVCLTDDLDARIEKVRMAGTLRKTVTKEAVQIRASLRKTQFLRDDFVVDLYKARQAIVKWLVTKLGSVRDYNGGMISKQMEIFLTFQERFKEEGALHEHRLSNFFHALYPIELRSAVSIHCLQEFYQIFCKAMESEQNMLMKEEGSLIYICLKENKSVLETVLSLKFPPFRLLQLQLNLDEKQVVGFVFFSQSEEEKNIFLQAISRCLN